MSEYLEADDSMTATSAAAILNNKNATAVLPVDTEKTSGLL